jgi:hypothetical protein
MPFQAQGVVSLRPVPSIFFRLWKNMAFFKVHGSEASAFYAASPGEVKVMTPFPSAAVNLNPNI